MIDAKQCTTGTRVKRAKMPDDMTGWIRQSAEYGPKVGETGTCMFLGESGLAGVRWDSSHLMVYEELADLEVCQE